MHTCVHVQYTPLEIKIWNAIMEGNRVVETRVEDLSEYLFLNILLNPKCTSA